MRQKIRYKQGRASNLDNQDDYAISSYKKAKEGFEKGVFKNEITSVSKIERTKTIVFDSDQDVYKLDEDRARKAKSAFIKDGSVTAPNSSTLADGAAALIIVSERKLNELLQKKKITFYEIVSFADHNQSPKEFTTAPSSAINKCLQRAKTNIANVDIFEINEAFSVVALANMKLLNLNTEKVNIYGGAVAMGPPLGCSGARIMVTLCNILELENKNTGCAAICNGGGGASAMIIKKSF